MSFRNSLEDQFPQSQEQQPETKSEINDKERKKMLREKYAEIFENIPRIGLTLESKDEGFEREFDLKQPVSWENFVFIRADTELPKQVKGEFRVQTPHERDETISRLTTHWCINHKVVSHSYGSWESIPYTFVVPAKDAIADNGNPENLYAVDTFWSHGVNLPKSTIIICNKNKETVIPLQMKEKLHIIEVEPEEDRAILSLVLEKMGYTELRGGAHYSESDKNVDNLVARLAKVENIDDIYLHKKHWTDLVEVYLSLSEGGDTDTIKNIFSQRGYGKCPDEIKNRIIQKATEEMQKEGKEFKANKSEISDFILAIIKKEFEVEYQPFIIIEDDISRKGKRKFIEPIKTILGNPEQFKQMEDKHFIKSATEETTKLFEMQADFIKRLPNDFWQALLKHEYRVRYGTRQPTEASLNEFDDKFIKPLKDRLTSFLNRDYNTERWEHTLSLK